MDQEMFIAAVENLKEFAKVNGSQVKKQDILDEFKGIDLEEGQLQLIYGYLQTNKIKITDVELKENAFEKIVDKTIENQVSETQEDSEIAKQQSLKLEEMNENDKKVLAMYLEDLEAITPLEDIEEVEILNKIKSGDKKAVHILAETYLGKIVKWVKPFQGRGVLLGDLIQEANLTMLAMITENNWKNDFGTCLKEKIEMVLQSIIDEQKGSSMVGQKILNKVNAVNDCVEQMYAELTRKVTLKEVAEEMGIPEEDVREAADLSANKIEHLQY